MFQLTPREWFGLLDFTETEYTLAGGALQVAFENPDRVYLGVFSAISGNELILSTKSTVVSSKGRIVDSTHPLELFHDHHAKMCGLDWYASGGPGVHVTVMELVWNRNKLGGSV